MEEFYISLVAQIWGILYYFTVLLILISSTFNVYDKVNTFDFSVKIIWSLINEQLRPWWSYIAPSYLFLHSHELANIGVFQGDMSNLL